MVSKLHMLSQNWPCAGYIEPMLDHLHPCWADVTLDWPHVTPCKLNSYCNCFRIMRHKKRFDTFGACFAGHQMSPASLNRNRCRPWHHRVTPGVSKPWWLSWLSWCFDWDSGGHRLDTNQGTRGRDALDRTEAAVSPSSVIQTPKPGWVPWVTRGQLGAHLRWSCVKLGQSVSEGWRTSWHIKNMKKAFTFCMTLLIP